MKHTPTQLYRLSDDAMLTHFHDVMQAIGDRPSLRRVIVPLLGDYMAEMKLEDVGRSGQPELFAALTRAVTHQYPVLAHPG